MIEAGDSDWSSVAGARTILARGPGYVVEMVAGLRSLCATGKWTAEAAAAMRAGDIEALLLSYVSGFSEVELDFIEPWPIRRLHFDNRAVRAIDPIARLAGSLESLGVHADPRGRVDLTGFVRLRQVDAMSANVVDTLCRAPVLEWATLWNYSAVDIGPLAGLAALRKVNLKAARKLASLAGLGELRALETVRIQGAPQLRDVSALCQAPDSLTQLALEACRAVRSLDPIAGARGLRELEIGDCGVIESLRPLLACHNLERIHLWGDNVVLDQDVDCLMQIPSLSSVSIEARRQYASAAAHVERAIAERFAR